MGNKIIRLYEVESKTGLSSSTIYLSNQGKAIPRLLLILEKGQ